MRKSILTILTLLVALSVLIGCGKSDSSADLPTKKVTYEGTTYEVPKQPKRIVALSNSLLSVVYALQGEAIGRPVSMEKLPPAEEKLPTVGHTGHINMEEVLALKPDLVLGLKDQHEKLVPQLGSSHIYHMMVSYDGIADNVPLIEALGKVLNKEDKAKEEISKYNNNIKKVKNAIAGKTPKKVIVIFASARSILAETDQAITGSMIKELGQTNLVMNHIQSGKESSKRIPYSLETLTIDNPDIIFVVTMGKREQINEQMKKTMTSNPAWNQLQAVQQNKVFYLPSHLFLLNPGLETPEAMAELSYYLYGQKIDL